MKHLRLKMTAALLFFVSLMLVAAAADPSHVKVMISGGFTAASLEVVP